MRYSKLRRCAGATTVVLTLLSAALPTSAHHSFAAYESMKTVTLSGTIKTFQWSNPHVVMSIVVQRDADALPQEWSIITSGPAILTRYGWTQNSIKPGDRVSALCNPLSDGSLGGRLHTMVKLDTGEKLLTKLSAPQADPN